MQIKHSTTIAAIATAVGLGGVAVVRLSGPLCYTIGCQLAKQQKLTPRHAHFVSIYDHDGTVLDQALMLYFPAPHSFTGEDVVEVQCHGGAVLPNLVLARCYELGAVQAKAGEFSYRAFDNGKLDLVQAEAISDAITASSRAEALGAIRSLSGVFSEQVNDLQETLIRIRLHVEAMIDFSDEEDVDFLADGVVIRQLDELDHRLTDALSGAKQGVLLNDGVHVVLAGKPNAGKSSLLNRLCGTERAIVTDIAGTTRDTLQERVVLDGLVCHITDTAGLHQSNDQVEKIGIERAKSAVKTADVVLFLYDVSKEDDPQAELIALLGEVPPVVIFVGNKVDLTARSAGLVKDMPKTLYVSCKNGAGIDALKTAIFAQAGYEPSANAIIARTRHVDALQRTTALVAEAKTQLLYQHAFELAAESLRLAQNSLSELTGVFSSDDLLGRIFSSFCIGK